MARTADRKAESPYAGAPAIALPARVGDAGTNVFFFFNTHKHAHTHTTHAMPLRLQVFRWVTQGCSLSPVSERTWSGGGQRGSSDSR